MTSLVLIPVLMECAAAIGLIIGAIVGVLIPVLMEYAAAATTSMSAREVNTS